MKRNPKAEIRRPKEGRVPKSESKSTTKGQGNEAFVALLLCSLQSAAVSAFGFRPSFGLRISAFGFSPQ